MHGCDFNKVTKWLCWDRASADRASARVFSSGFASYLYSVFVGEHFWRTASEHR